MQVGKDAINQQYAPPKASEVLNPQMLNASITQASDEDEDIEDQISSRTVKHSIAKRSH